MSRIGEATTCSAVKTNLIPYIGIADVCHLIAYEYAVDCMLVWLGIESAQDTYGVTGMVRHTFKLSEFATVQNLLTIFQASGDQRIWTQGERTVWHNFKKLQGDTVLDMHRHSQSAVLILCSNTRGMKIRLGRGKIHEHVLDVESSDTIGSIKARMQARQSEFGLSLPRLELVFASKKLMDERTLADYNIQSGDCISWYEVFA